MKMEEKNELLKIVSKRLKIAKLYIGESIINAFPKINLKSRLKEEKETVELILEEANQYGLRYEVDEFAKKFLKEDPTLSDLEAYVMAYNEWIK
jgi:hypothetical protein